MKRTKEELKFDLEGLVFLINRIEDEELRSQFLDEIEYLVYRVFHELLDLHDPKTMIQKQSKR